MMDQVLIGHGFCGPDGIGQGGYVCGLVAQAVDGDAEVTLHKPAPLGQPLTLEPGEGGRANLRHGEILIAQGVPAAKTDLEVPEAPDFAAAEAASTRYAGHEHTAYPNCFVCGRNRMEDGMRIFAGPVDGGGILASPWLPDARFADETGAVRAEFIWAALDCPGGFAVNDDPYRKILLGRMSARQYAPVRVGQRHIATAWMTGGEGRKRYSGAAIFAEDGTLKATAQGTWILPRE